MDKEDFLVQSVQDENFFAPPKIKDDAKKSRRKSCLKPLNTNAPRNIKKSEKRKSVHFGADIVEKFEKNPSQKARRSSLKPTFEISEEEIGQNFDRLDFRKSSTRFSLPGDSMKKDSNRDIEYDSNDSIKEAPEEGNVKSFYDNNNDLSMSNDMDFTTPVGGIVCEMDRDITMDFTAHVGGIVSEMALNNSMNDSLNDGMDMTQHHAQIMYDATTQDQEKENDSDNGMEMTRNYGQTLYEATATIDVQQQQQQQQQQRQQQQHQMQPEEDIDEDDTNNIGLYSQFKNDNLTVDDDTKGMDFTCCDGDIQYEQPDDGNVNEELLDEVQQSMKKENIRKAQEQEQQQQQLQQQQLLENQEQNENMDFTKVHGGIVQPLSVEDMNNDETSQMDFTVFHTKPMTETNDSIMETSMNDSAMEMTEFHKGFVDDKTLEDNCAIDINNSTSMDFTAHHGRIEEENLEQNDKDGDRFRDSTAAANMLPSNGFEKTDVLEESSLEMDFTAAHGGTPINDVLEESSLAMDLTASYGSIEQSEQSSHGMDFTAFHGEQPPVGESHDLEDTGNHGGMDFTTHHENEQFKTDKQDNESEDDGTEHQGMEFTAFHNVDGESETVQAQDIEPENTETQAMDFTTYHADDSMKNSKIVEEENIESQAMEFTTYHADDSIKNSKIGNNHTINGDLEESSNTKTLNQDNLQMDSAGMDFTESHSTSIEKDCPMASGCSPDLLQEQQVRENIIQRTVTELQSPTNVYSSPKKHEEQKEPKEEKEKHQDQERKEVEQECAMDLTESLGNIEEDNNTGRSSTQPAEDAEHPISFVMDSTVTAAQDPEPVKRNFEERHEMIPPDPNGITFQNFVEMSRVFFYDNYANNKRTTMNHEKPTSLYTLEKRILVGASVLPELYEVGKAYENIAASLEELKDDILYLENRINGQNPEIFRTMTMANATEDEDLQEEIAQRMQRLKEYAKTESKSSISERKLLLMKHIAAHLSERVDLLKKDAEKYNKACLNAVLKKQTEIDHIVKDLQVKCSAAEKASVSPVEIANLEDYHRSAKQQEDQIQKFQKKNIDMETRKNELSMEVKKVETLKSELDSKLFQNKKMMEGFQTVDKQISWEDICDQQLQLINASSLRSFTYTSVSAQLLEFSFFDLANLRVHIEFSPSEDTSNIKQLELTFNDSYGDSIKKIFNSLSFASTFSNYKKTSCLPKLLPELDFYFGRINDLVNDYNFLKASKNITLFEKDDRVCIKVIFVNALKGFKVAVTFLDCIDILFGRIIISFESQIMLGNLKNEEVQRTIRSNTTKYGGLLSLCEAVDDLIEQA